MKTKLVSFERIECDSLAKLMKHLASSPDIAEQWQVAKDDCETFSTVGAPLRDDYNVDVNRPYLQSIHRLVSATGVEEHSAAGLSEPESDAMHDLWGQMQAAFPPGRA